MLDTSARLLRLLSLLRARRDVEVLEPLELKESRRALGKRLTGL